MDGSAFRNLNLGPLIWFAGIGMLATVIAALALLIGGGWWIWHHVAIV